MRRLRDGDAAAFRALHDRDAAVVFSVAYRIVRDRSAAEDVTQEAFLALWRCRNDYKPSGGSSRGWLLTITQNRAIDSIRKRRGYGDQPLGVDHEEQESPERTDEAAFQRDEATTVCRALRVLPDAQRAVLDLAYYGGLTHSEIADRLRVPLGTVKGRLRLGLQKLADELQAPAAALT